MFLEHIDGKRILVMAGHVNNDERNDVGGLKYNPFGTQNLAIRGETHYTCEAQIVLDIALKLRDILAGYVPLHIHPPAGEPAPDDDLLSEAHADVMLGHGTFARKARLVHLASRVRPLDAILELHVNAFNDPAVRGFECWVGKDPVSATLAQCLLDAAAGGPHSVLPRHGVHWMYQENNPNRTLFEYIDARPMVLIECGYVTNPDDSKLLTMPVFQDTLALKLAIGLDGFFAQLNAGPGAGGSNP